MIVYYSDDVLTFQLLPTNSVLYSRSNFPKGFPRERNDRFGAESDHKGSLILNLFAIGIHYHLIEVIHVFFHHSSIIIIVIIRVIPDFVRRKA